jgi:hypothetical protein
LFFITFFFPDSSKIKGKCFPFEVLEEEWDDDSKD